MPEAVALSVFGAIAMLATLVLVGQGLMPMPWCSGRAARSSRSCCWDCWLSWP